MGARAAGWAKSLTRVPAMLGEREQGLACLGGKWYCILRVEIVWNMGNNPQIFEVEVLPGPVSEQSVRNGTAIRDS